MKRAKAGLIPAIALLVAVGCYKPDIKEYDCGGYAVQKEEINTELGPVTFLSMYGKHKDLNATDLNCDGHYDVIAQYDKNEELPGWEIVRDSRLERLVQHCGSRFK